MRSLYLKIFLWFWGAMVLMAAAVFWVSYQVADSSGATRPAAARMAFAALRNMQRLADVVSSRGIEAARPLIRRYQRPGNPQLFMVDAGGGDGRDVLGRPLPPGIRGMGGAPAVNEHGVTFMTQDVAAPSGHRYRIIGLFGGNDSMAAAASTAPAGAPSKPSGARALKTAGRIFRAPPDTQWPRLGVAILVSGIVCFLLARYLARPLVQLRGATRSLSEGNLAARAGVSVTARRDEIGALGRDFDDMADRVEGLLRSQRRLLRDVSHELRSPLSRLQVALGLARKRAVSEVNPELDRIELETERLNELIGQILTLTHLEQELASEQSVSVDLAGIVRDVVEDAKYEAGARQRKVELSATVEGSVQGRPQLLHSAIENVVRNAVRYTAENTAVEISMTSSDGRIAIQVRDQGPGVPEAALGHLFEPFYRVDDDRGRGGGGYGIGLAITERTLRRHGGTLSARNHPAGGLVVELELPRSRID